MNRPVAAVLLGLALSAGCGAPPTAAPTTASADPARTSAPAARSGLSSTAPTTAPLTSEEPVTTTPMSTTPLRLTIGDVVVTAELDDNPTARDLLTRLPLTSTLADFNRVEKTVPLQQALTLDDAPRGADPELHDIGYYAPDRVLVLYYGEVGYHDGIVRIGRFGPADAELIETRPDGTTVTIAAP